MIRDAIQEYEQPAKPLEGRRSLKQDLKSSSLQLQVQSAFMAGDYDRVIRLVPAGEDVPPEVVDSVSWAYVAQGNALSEQAKQKSDGNIDQLKKEIKA